MVEQPEIILLIKKISADMRKCVAESYEKRNAAIFKIYEEMRPNITKSYAETNADR